MTIWFHRYELVPRRSLSALGGDRPRSGALIRVGDGFADVHPWPELGDTPLDEQLRLLARGETTALTRASLRLARADGDARRRAVSLFAGLVIPESHWPGSDPPSEFDTVKLKSVDAIPPGVRLRIDFNGRLAPREFRDLMETLPLDRIDFIEDPVPFDEDVWDKLRQQTGCRLALDRIPPGSMPSRARDVGCTATESDDTPVIPSGRRVGGEGPPADDPKTRPNAGLSLRGVDVVIHKPALSADFPAFSGEVVVTSYMDHPVGQFGAAWVAASNQVSARCGLMTHVLFELDEFIEQVSRDGARLLPPAGSGVGFDDLLEGLSWKRLR